MKTYINPYKQFNGVFIPDWLLESDICSVNAKVMYALLTRYAGQDGFCYPKQSTLANRLGTSRRSVINYLKELQDCELIDRKRTKGNNNYFFLEHDLMKQSANFAHTKVQDVAHTDVKDSSHTYKENHNKENHSNILVQGVAFDEKDKIVDILEKVDLTKDPESNEEKYSLLALHIWNDVNELQPNNQTTLKAKIGSWYHPIRLMAEQDNRDVHGIWKIWKLAHRDDFWKKNVLSTQKLRDQFDRLAIKFNLNDNKTYEIIDALYG